MFKLHKLIANALCFTFCDSPNKYKAITGDVPMFDKIKETKDLTIITSDQSNANVKVYLYHKEDHEVIKKWLNTHRDTTQNIIYHCDSDSCRVFYKKQNINIVQKSCIL